MNFRLFIFCTLSSCFTLTKVQSQTDKDFMLYSVRETELLDFLKSKQISHLVICGMMTYMCIDTTTRAAYDLGLNSIVIGDACATKDLELNGEKVNAKEVQIAYLSALNGTFANIQKTAEFIC